MSTTIKATLALLLCIILGLAWFGFKIGQEREIARRQARNAMIMVHDDMYQEVRCYDRQGELGTYTIFMPLEVTSRGKAAMDAYALGYCRATHGPQGTRI